MNLLVPLVLLACVVGALCAECSSCTTTYEGARDTGGASNTDKCTALKTYLDCLETATGSSCPLETTKAAAITTDYTQISATCPLDPLCACQKSYWETDVTSGDPAKCTAAEKRFACLRGKTGSGCGGGASTFATLAATTNTLLTGVTCSTTTPACTCEKTYVTADVGDATKMCTESKKYMSCVKGKGGNSCDPTKTATVAAGEVNTVITNDVTCTVAPTPLCQCELDYATSDISDAPKKCIATKNFMSCLLGKTGAACVAGSTLITLATAAETTINGDASCAKTDVCTCEIAYAKADVSDNPKKCAETKTLTHCIYASINNGCGASTTKTSVGTVAAAAFTALTSTNCPLSEACTCQNTFNGLPVTTALKCTSATTFQTCLDAITSTTDTACDGTTLASAFKVTTKTNVKDKLCSAGFKSEMSLFMAFLMLTLTYITTYL